MATQPGYVGRRVLLIGLFAGATLGVAVVLAVLGFHWWWCSLIAALLVVGIHLASSSGRILDPWSWIRGLDGQAYVSAELRGLVRLGYHIVEPVDIRHGDVDHVVVGPGGVFAIETKNWPGRIVNTSGGLRREGWDVSPAIQQAVRNAIAIRDLVGLRWVEAVLVCVNATVEGDPIVLNKVTVTTPAGLQWLVTSRPRKLTEDQIQEVLNRLPSSSCR